jgi:hypothetical protein
MNECDKCNLEIHKCDREECVNELGEKFFCFEQGNTHLHFCSIECWHWWLRDENFENLIEAEKYEPTG